MFTAIILLALGLEAALSSMNYESGSSFILQNGDQVPKHQFVHYLTEGLLAHETKVKEFSINKTVFYSHVYDAHDLSDSKLSIAAINEKHDFVGANLVLNHAQIHRMFAPDYIEKILVFLLKCYEVTKPNGFANDDGFVSILRNSNTKAISKILLKNTWRKISAKALLEDKAIYHFLWEIEDPETDSLLKNLGYQQMGCGNELKECDWTQVGMREDLARVQCLYRIEINAKGPLVYQEKISD